MKFTDFNLKPQLLQAIQKIGYAEPTEIQKKCFEPVFSGRDIIGKSQTGTGKTVAFLLPLLQRLEPSYSTEVLIVCPTRELANQVVEQLRNLLQNSEGVKALAVFGGQSIDRQITALKKGCQFIVGTPGRIMDHLNRKTLKLGSLKTLVLDEADEMLNMGFKEDINKILKSCPKEIQTLLFSATMPPEILRITKEYQTMPEMIEIAKEQATASKLKQYYVYNKELVKEKVILQLIQEFKPKLGLIFVNTIIRSKKLKDFFEKNGQSAYLLNGDMRQSERTRTMQAYKSGKESLLIATDVAARGIDVNDIDYVFNFDLPQNIEYYVHRIGRTARAGKEGVSITIVNSAAQMKDIALLEKKLNIKINKLNTTSVEQEVYENNDAKSKSEYGVSKEKLPRTRPKENQDKKQTGFKTEKNLFFKNKNKEFNKKSEFKNKTNAKPEFKDERTFKDKTNTSPKFKHKRDFINLNKTDFSKKTDIENQYVKVNENAKLTKNHNTAKAFKAESASRPQKSNGKFFNSKGTQGNHWQKRKSKIK